MSKRLLIIIILFFSVLVIFTAISAQQNSQDKTPKEKLPPMKVKITNPKPGEVLKGTIKIEWQLINPCSKLAEEEKKKKEEQQKTQTEEEKKKQPTYIIHYYVDYQLVGENTDLDPPFELDTTNFKNGNYIISINVVDPCPHVASAGVKVKIKN